MNVALAFSVSLLMMAASLVVDPVARVTNVPCDRTDQAAELRGIWVQPAVRNSDGTAQMSFLEFQLSYKDFGDVLTTGTYQLSRDGAPVSAGALFDVFELESKAGKRLVLYGTEHKHRIEYAVAGNKLTIVSVQKNPQGTLCVITPGVWTRK